MHNYLFVKNFLFGWAGAKRCLLSEPLGGMAPCPLDPPMFGGPKCFCFSKMYFHFIKMGP